MGEHSHKAIHHYVDNYVIVDFETTGKFAKYDHIVEIGAIKVRKGKIIDTFSTLVNTTRKIAEDASDKTHITNETIKDAPSFNEIVDTFLEFIKGEVLVGFNIASFDYIVLNNEVRRCKGVGIENQYLELMNDLKRELFELDNHKLETICNYLGINNPNAHRALNDCYMVEASYRWLRGDKRYKEINVPYIETYNLVETPKHIIIEDTGANRWPEYIQHMLNELVVELELPKGSLYVGANVGKDNQITSYSICIYEPDYPFDSNSKVDLTKNSSVMVIKENKNELHLTMKKIQFDNVGYTKELKIKSLKSTPNMITIIFNLINEDLLEFVRMHTIYRVNTYTSKAATFSCCSKFIECSNAKKCIHTNKLYSKACTYRRNLENGRIFYRKNKNI